ncbi:MAG TPA: hypothetical protein VJU87_00805 [Gemmatimonadaceae bacterium]|nr:hypothetical protein [Gemmatimonadaceae bacterium]
MSVVFLTAFIVGLLLAVGVMLFGVERHASGGERSAGSLHTWVPVAAAFAILFGLVGYLLLRSGERAVLPLAGALLAGAVAAVLGWWTVVKSAAIVPEFDVDDERYVLQGHIARVVDPIGPGEAGEGQIAFDVGPQQRTLRARTVDGVALDAGAEVVIERIEGDVAFVEPWMQVEKRL